MDIVTAKMIPAGATIVRAHWSAPRGYVNPGPEFNTEAEAVAHAISEVREAVAKHDEYYAVAKERGSSLYVPLPERITIDLRWYIEYPNGGGSDIVVARTEFKDIAKAEQHLARLTKFGGE